MTPEPICIAEEASLESAMHEMQSHNIRRLVVVNEAQELVGIITLDDIIGGLAEEQELLTTMAKVMGGLHHEKG